MPDLRAISRPGSLDRALRMHFLIPSGAAETLQLLRDMAARAVLRGKAEEPEPHPDAELLAVCGLVLDLAAGLEAISREMDALPPCYECQSRDEGWEARKPLWAEYGRIDREMRKPMRRIGTLRATTPAGIFAKALVLRRSKGNAPRLALTLAQELLDCPGLRAAIWGADAGNIA